MIVYLLLFASFCFSQKDCICESNVITRNLQSSIILSCKDEVCYLNGLQQMKYFEFLCTFTQNNYSHNFLQSSNGMCQSSDKLSSKFRESQYFELNCEKENQIICNLQNYYTGEKIEGIKCQCSDSDNMIFGNGSIPNPPDPLPTNKHELFFYIMLGLCFVIVFMIVFLVYLFVPITLFVKNKVIKYEKKDKLNVDIFEFKNIFYRVKVGSEEQVIINNVSAKIEKGEMFAILGTSGAGKSSLLDIISAREKQGKVNGRILIDGENVGRDYKKYVGYVNQDDHDRLMGSLTVEEYFHFASDLRSKEIESKENKKEKINKMLEFMELNHIRKRFIGTLLSRSISGGEKKRVVVGMELLGDKPIIMFDEPTSGLDSNSAISVIKTLSKFCKENGKIMVFSIHQPSSKLFELFDKILLLHNGEEVFFGESKGVKKFLTNLNFDIPKGYSVPDYLLDLVKNEEDVRSIKEENRKAKIKRYHSELTTTEVSPLIYSQNKDDGIYDPLLNRAESTIEAIPIIKTSKWKEPCVTSQLHQFKILNKRTFKNFYRDLFLLPGHLVFSLGIGLIIGAVYFYLPHDFFGTLSLVGGLFFVCMVIGVSTITSLSVFVQERNVYVREKSNCLYKPLPYFLSKLLFDIIPLRVVPAIIISFVYFLIGLRLEVISFLWFMFILVVLNICCGAICLTVSALSSDVGLANMVCLTVMFYFLLFGGLLVNKGSLHGVMALNRYISPFNYALESLIANELENKWIWFDPATIPKKTYSWLNGNYILETLNFSSIHFTMDVAVLCVLTFIYLLISGATFTVFVKERK